MRHYLTGFALLALAAPAAAADKPVIAPSPAWVKAVALPPTPKTDEAAIRLVLQDEQVLFEPGRRTVYSRTAMQLQTPQGLAAGNISLPWRPDVDLLTVHAVLIHRGDKVIDVLASGQTFTVVRREANLENASLDGVLTANIQPEGLEVGDILDIAISLSSSDPVLKGHVEQMAGAWNVLPIARARLRMQWPASMPLRVRSADASAALKTVTRDGVSSVELSSDGITPTIPPKGAPMRYQIGRLVEATDFASWSQLAALMAPLYAKAAVLPSTGPLQSEVARIKALSPDPAVRAEAALALVQDRVRYAFRGMDGGNYVPADAEVTWSKRFGDCKGKTALLLGLLKAFGIEAEAVLVNASEGGDGLDAHLPMATWFNHVLVRATIGGRTYWMDGTRTGDKTLGRLRTPPFGWGLPLAATNAVLVRMLPVPLDEPDEVLSIRMDATGGLTVPAPTRIERLTRGDGALAMNIWLSNLSGEARDRALREYWRNEYDFIDVKTATASFDPLRGEHRLVLEGAARMQWKDGWYETDGTALGYKADFSRDPGIDRDAPFAVAYPRYARTTETILLPPGVPGFRMSEKADVNEMVAGVQYRRTAKIVGNVATVEKSERSIAPEFAATQALAAQKALRDLAERTVYVARPNLYRHTDKEVDAVIASTPTNAYEFNERGYRLMDRGKHDEAIADFDRAITLDPKYEWAFANRGMAYAWKGEPTSAAKDLDAATALNPANPVVFRARGILAERRKDWAAAVVAFNRSLEIDPANELAWYHLVAAQRAAGNTDAALADAARAIKRNPAALDMYLLRANMLHGKKPDEAIAEAGALMKANPDSVEAHVGAARILDALGKKDEAMRAFDRALAIRPDSLTYINRAEIRPRNDVAGRRADLEAAAKLDPSSGFANVGLAKLHEQEGDDVAALAAWSAAIASQPEAPEALIGRGVLHARTGQEEAAAKDFAAARAISSDPNALNALCWAKATAGVALVLALSDCNDALAKAPDSPAYLDSRALVYLKLGQLDKAMTDYDAALKGAPEQTASLYGRSVVWARKGDKARSDVDAAAAIALNPDIERRFADYKIKR